MFLKLPIRTTGLVLRLTLLLALTFQLGVAYSSGTIPKVLKKRSMTGAPVIDTNRYIGLTIFNFEMDPRVDDERIEHSASIGCNAVEITINWDQVYANVNSTPVWHVIDSHVQTAQRLGLKIALRVHIGREAYKLGGFWGIHETMQAADSSRSVKHGIVQFSLSHQPTIDRAGAFVREVAERYHYIQQEGQLLFFSVVSSPALESEYSPVYDPPSGTGKYVVPYDYGVYELSEFRNYLQARFSLSQLNQRWNTDFSQWSKVMPPPNERSNPYASHMGVRGNDWYVFRHRQLKRFIDKINGIVKGVDPGIVMVNQHGCTWDRLSGLRATYAFKDLAKSADGLKFNDGPDYNHRFSMDVVRSNLKKGAFMINAVDGMFYNTVSTEKYYEQVVQCYEHGAKMLTLANFFASGARVKLRELVAMVKRDGLLNHRVTEVKTVGNAIGYKLSDILTSHSIAQQRWNQRYNQNGKKPVFIELDEDLLREAPKVINSLPVLTQTLTDQSALIGQPFSYSIGQAFTDSDGTIDGVEASNLPEGIQWSSASGVFSGTPTRVESSVVTLTARDNLGAVATGSFHMTVTDPNVANKPPVAPVLTAQNGQVGNAFSYNLPPFRDPEELPLVHFLAGLPDGMTYSAETNVLSGTPTTAGVYSLTYSAVDPSEVLSSVNFQLTIKEATPPPKRTGNFEGYLDTFNCEGDIWGWVWDRNLPNASIPIEILDGLNVIATFNANVKRADLVAAKKGNGVHGYQFIIPNSLKDGQPHVISMRVENSDYYLKGSPRMLNCPASTAQTTDPTNNPPVAVSIPVQNAYLNIPFSYTLPEFLHEEGQTLTYAVSGGVAGLTYDQSTRTFSGKPSQIGTFTASLIVSDGNGGYTPATVSVTVTAAPANRPPVVSQSIANQTATVDQSFTFTIPANTFSDPDGNLAGIQVSNLPAGLTYTSANRTISGTPTSAGEMTVTVVATDALNASVNTTFQIKVEGAPKPGPVINKPPVIVQAPINQTATVGQSFQFQIPMGTFSDPDGSIVRIEVSGLPAGLDYVADSRTIHGKLTTPETATISVTGTDNEGASVTARFELQVVSPANKLPQVANVIPDQTATVGQKFRYVIDADTFTDPDGSIEKIEIVGGLPAGLDYTPNTRVISGTPSAPTTATITVKATDDQGASVVTKFRLTVNPEPVAENKPPVVAQTIPDQAATIGQPFVYVIGTNVFTDPDGEITKVEVTSSLPDGLTYDLPVRSISGTPTAAVGRRGVSGAVTEPITTTVVVKATDNHGESVTTTFRLTVNPAANALPVVAQPIADQTATVGQPFSYTLGENVFADSDGSIAKVEVVSGLPAGLTYSSGNQIISGTASTSATTTITVKATDNQGGSVTTTFRLTVNPAANALPVVAQPIADQTATVGQPFSYTLGENVFADSDGSIAKVEVVSGLPAGFTYSSGNQVISGTASTSATTTITVKATDNQGGSVTTTFRLTVNPAANALPVVAQPIADQTATVGQPFSYTLGENVFADSDGSIAKVEVVSGLPAGFTYSSGNQVISGTASTSATTTVTVKATDNQGGSVTTTFRLTVNPAPAGVNQPPVLAKEIPSQTATIGIDYAFVVGSQYFSDPDGSIALIEVTNLPKGLAYNKTTGLISGVTTKAQSVTVSVKATDNKGASVTTTFALQINENIVMKLYKAGKGPEKQNYIQDLNDGEVLYANALPASINVFFEIATNVSSVRFELRGPKTVLFQENFAPWALCGDNGGVPLFPGIYTLKVIGYKKPNLQSNLLVERVIMFEVKPSGKRESAEVAQSVWGVYPNPFRDQLVVQLPEEGTSQSTPLAPYRFSILSPDGRQMTIAERDTQIESGKAVLNVQGAGLSTGLYFLQIRRGESMLRTLKILKE